MDMKVISQGGQPNLGSSVNATKTNGNTESINLAARKNSTNDMDVNNKNENKNNVVKKKELDKAVQKLNGFLEDENACAKLSFHDNSTRLIVTIYDENDKIIMQLPSEKVLEMVDKMSESLGVSIDKKA